MQKQEVHETAARIMAEAKAVITGSHVVYASDKHGSAYVNKDALYTNPDWLDGLCKLIAEEFRFINVDRVVSPAVGGVNLATSVTRELRRLTGKDIRGLYAEHAEESLAKGPRSEPTLLLPGEEMLIRKPSFVINRGYDRLVANGERVLVVEDVLTTGSSARQTVSAVRTAGGNVVGVAAVCNRGNIGHIDLGVEMLFSLINVQLQAFDEDKCPLCAQGVPINTAVGKGKAFLARHKE